MLHADADSFLRAFPVKGKRLRCLESVPCHHFFPHGRPGKGDRHFMFRTADVCIKEWMVGLPWNPGSSDLKFLQISSAKPAICAEFCHWESPPLETCSWSEWSAVDAVRSHGRGAHHCLHREGMLGEGREGFKWWKHVNSSEWWHSSSRCRFDGRVRLFRREMEGRSKYSMSMSKRVHRN